MHKTECSILEHNEKLSYEYAQYFIQYFGTKGKNFRSNMHKTSCSSLEEKAKLPQEYVHDCLKYSGTNDKLSQENAHDCMQYSETISKTTVGICTRLHIVFWKMGKTPLIALFKYYKRVSWFTLHNNCYSNYYTFQNNF